MTKIVMITMATKSSSRRPSKARCGEVLGAKNAGYIDLSSIKKSFENCKSAVLAVKRLAGDNIQPLFASGAIGDDGSSGGGGGGNAGGGGGDGGSGGGGWFPVWLADWVDRVSPFPSAFVPFSLHLSLSLSERSEGWRGTGMRIRPTVGQIGETERTWMLGIRPLFS